ncbi:hypothetical protein AX16_000159 [Volvariella volvacea WC 439]|nr:hypothetical protein AX16_000159 [Volvariella volvacea WC 439]
MSMLALNTWRTSTIAGIRGPFSSARYLQTTGPTITTVGETVKSQLTADSPNKVSAEADPNPPIPGPDGYPPPRPPKAPNPLTERRASSISRALQARPKYRLHCHSTRNNTITTLTRPDGSPIAWFSGGSCGFKKGNRATYEAGYQCAVRMFKTIEDLAKDKPLEIELFFKGFGQGRDALHKALLTSEGNAVRPLVTTITDRTPIKIGGTRAKKMRRL